MKHARVAVILSVATWLSCAALGGQVVPAGSRPPATSDTGCLNASSSMPSAASARCDAMARSGDMLDGGRHLLFSMGAMGGYDSAFAARKGIAAPFEGATLRLGALSMQKNSYKLFDNTASGMDYHLTPRTWQYLNSTNISVSQMPSPRTILGFDLNNLFGNDAIRIFEFSGPDSNPESASYGIHSGKVLDNQATVRLSRQSTDTRWWSVAVRNNFRDFIDDHSRVNTIHGRAEIQYQPSPRAGIGVFEETAMQSGDVDCTSQSVGLVYERRFSATTSAEVAGGPAFGSRGCVSKVTGIFSGAFSTQPLRSANFWVSAHRQLNDSQFAALTYENNAQAGWMQQFGLNAWLKVQGGWLGGTVPERTNPFHGIYVASTFGRRLGGGFSTSVSVENFRWSGVSNIPPTRTLVTGSVYWSPSKVGPENLHGLVAR